MKIPLFTFIFPTKEEIFSGFKSLRNSSKQETGRKLSITTKDLESLLQRAHFRPTLILRFTSTWKSASTHSIQQVSPVSHCGPSVSFVPLIHALTPTIRARPLFRWNVRVVVFLSFPVLKACYVSRYKSGIANSWWQYLYTNKNEGV